MASIDGGTLASQKELKCQINSVRAPDTQEFLYLAPWEADKDRLCVSEQALTKHWGFFYSSSTNFCLLFLLLLLSFERCSGSMSVDVTPLAQHLSCTQPTSPLCCVSTIQTQIHPFKLTLLHPLLWLLGIQAARIFQTFQTYFFFFTCLFMSSIAENGQARIYFLSGLSVLAELLYDMLVVNRSREPYTHTRVRVT